MASVLINKLMLWYKLTITRAKKVNRYERFVFWERNIFFSSTPLTAFIAYITLFHNDFRACEKTQQYTSQVRIIFNLCLISPISCWHVTRPSLHSVRLMNEWWNAHHSLVFRHKKFWCIMVYLRTLKRGTRFYLIRIYVRWRGFLPVIKPFTHQLSIFNTRWQN